MSMKCYHTDNSDTSKSIEFLWTHRGILMIPEKFFEYSNLCILCTNNIVCHLDDLRSLRYFEYLFCHMYRSLMMFYHIFHEGIIQIMIRKFWKVSHHRHITNFDSIIWIPWFHPWSKESNLCFLSRNNILCNFLEFCILSFCYDNTRSINGLLMMRYHISDEFFFCRCTHMSHFTSHSIHIYTSMIHTLHSRYFFWSRCWSSSNWSRCCGICSGFCISTTCECQRWEDNKSENKRSFHK